MSKKTFENAMEELETAVKELEKGNTTLEEALELFEKGVGLTRECQTMLDDAEKKVSVLLKTQSGDIQKKEFPTE